MKILHLIESGGFYGAERVLIDLCQAQQQQGDYPTILSVGPTSAGPRLLEQAAADSGISIKPWRMNRGANVVGMRKILKWANAAGVEVYHSHGYRFDILLALADPMIRLRRVATVHGLTLSKTGSLRASLRAGLFCLRRTRQSIFVSEGLRRTYGAHLKNAVVIHNGICISPIQAERSQPPIKNAKRIDLVAVGRLAYEKNYSLLLDTIAELGQRNIPCQLQHFGEGRLRAELDKQAQTLGLNNVQFRGYTDQVLKEINAADVLVFSSKTEGMPVTIIEAMMLGVPVVSTAVGGVPEMLAGYPLGRTTKEHCATALADRILEVCSTEASARATPATIAQIEQRFSAQRMASDYRAIYDQLT